MMQEGLLRGAFFSVCRAWPASTTSLPICCRCRRFLWVM